MSHQFQYQNSVGLVLKSWSFSYFTPNNCRENIFVNPIPFFYLRELEARNVSDKSYIPISRFIFTMLCCLDYSDEISLVRIFSVKEEFRKGNL